MSGPAPTVLVTGAAGFIGSHMCVELLSSGWRVVGADNFTNSSPGVLDAIGALGGGSFEFHELDVCADDALEILFARYPIEAVVHFAALKAPRESVQMPIEYYSDNLGATLALARAMERHDVTRLIFSSSCSIYGDTSSGLIVEGDEKAPTNPYARSKWMGEQMLADICAQREDWSVLALRYFNPTGAHESGDLGEDPSGVPVNVMPYVAQVAVGRLERLQIYGGDYPTPDGTGVRDYIHVLDLVEGHRRALEVASQRRGFEAYNLGTGIGSSVLELVTTFSAVSGREIPYEIVDRRPGDVATLVASPKLAQSELDWHAGRGLEAMCRDAWRFQQRHPAGY